MKKNSVLVKMLLMSTLSAGTILSLSSCSDYDDPVSVNIAAEKMEGLWYSVTDAQGTIGQGADAQEYCKIVNVADFQNGTEGIWIKYHINSVNEVIMSDGGYYLGNFIYTSKADGTVDIDINHNTIGKPDMKNFTMHYSNNGFNAGNFSLIRPSKEQKEQIQVWGRSIGLGAGSDGIAYNINSDDKFDTPFTRDNWRSSDAIYLFTGSSIAMGNKIVDPFGNRGYEKVLLPWANIDSNGASARKSNLPANFCDDVTPEKGWELVANFCGDPNNANNNFIALYNKYLGKLRYFYYIPGNVGINGAADHNFEILMQNGTAEHTVFGYAAPMDKTISKPEAIRAKHDGYWSMFVTPWAATTSQLGHITPDEGWYAFDIDLSVYRGNGNSMQSDRIIKPFIRGYKNDNVSMFGKLNTEISGEIDLKQCSVTSQNGLFGTLDGMFGQVKDIRDFIGNAKEIYGNITKGDFFGAIEGGLSLAKQGCDMVGIDYGQSEEGFNGYKGDVNMKMSGNIDFLGKISSDNVIQGFSKAEQSIKAFDIRDTHMGEGIWNLETSPVVYYTDAMVQWRYEYNTREYVYRGGPRETSFIWWTDRKSPFRAQKNADRSTGVVKTSKDPWAGYVNYFDPSSVKVVLNPNLFSADEINNAKVYATCGVRKANSAFGSVDKFRTAMGLSGSKFSYDKRTDYVNRPFTEAPFDALSSCSDKMNMNTGATFKATKYDGHNCGMFGRGDSDYILEPIPLSGDDHALCTYMPSYEVTVTVIVEHDGKPIVYSRTYLPEYKKMNAKDIPFMSSQDIEAKRPANYSKEIFATQMNHINDIHNWVYRTLQPNFVGPSIIGNNLSTFITTKQEDRSSETYPNLVDGRKDTKWCSNKYCVISPYDKKYNDHRFRRSYGHAIEYNMSDYNKSNVCWTTEFFTHQPGNPTGFTLYLAPDAAIYSDRNPKEIYLLGRKNESEKFTVLYHTRDAGLPKVNNGSKSFKLQNSANGMKFFRIEVLNGKAFPAENNRDPELTTKGNEYMQIAEFEFNYND